MFTVGVSRSKPTECPYGIATLNKNGITARGRTRSGVGLAAPRPFGRARCSSAEERGLSEPAWGRTRPSSHLSKQAHEGPVLINGGWGGIRTHDTLLTYTHFPGVRLRPLGHPSSPCSASRGGQEARKIYDEFQDCKPTWRAVPRHNGKRLARRSFIWFFIVN